MKIILENNKIETDSIGNELTSEQVNFFKDSKIRNFNTKQLFVCYHATNNDFDTFDKSFIGSGSGGVFGSGFYFTTHSDTAKSYGSKLGSYYLNITNPYDYYNTSKDTLLNLLNKSGYKYDQEFVDNFDYDDWDADLIDDYLHFALIDVDPYKVVSEMIQKAGYDGILAGSEIIAFEPNQIKLTLNKQPTNSDKLNESNLQDEKAVKVFAKDCVDFGWDMMEYKEFADTIGKQGVHPTQELYQVYVDTYNHYNKEDTDYIDVVRNKFEQMSSNEIIDLLGVPNSNDIDTNSPMFILPNGSILSVAQAGKLIGQNLNNNIHSDMVYVILSAIAKKYNYDWNMDDGYYEESKLNFLTYDLGWARVNCGQTWLEDRFYCVLPNHMTSAQYRSLEKWLEWGADTGKEEVLVYVGSDEVSQTYGLEETFPEDIIKKIKRYYSSGKLYESLNESLHKLGSNCFITDSPYDIKNLLLNKPKLYRILYDANIDMYMIGDGKQIIHWDMIREAYKQGYYYNIEEFIDELGGTLDNYVETGMYGLYNDDYEVDPYLFYMVYTQDENEFTIGEDGYGFVYYAEKGFLFTRDDNLDECELSRVLKLKTSVNEYTVNESGNELKENMDDFSINELSKMTNPNKGDRATIIDNEDREWNFVANYWSKPGYYPGMVWEGQKGNPWTSNFGTSLGTIKSEFPRGVKKVTINNMNEDINNKLTPTQAAQAVKELKLNSNPNIDVYIDECMQGVIVTFEGTLEGGEKITLWDSNILSTQEQIDTLPDMYKKQSDELNRLRKVGYKGIRESINNGYRMDNGMIEDDYFTFERDNITYHFFFKPTRRTDKGQYAIMAVDYGVRFDKEPYKDEKGHTIIPMSRVHDKPQQMAYFEFNEDTHPEITYAMTEDDRKEYRDLVVAETKKHINESYTTNNELEQRAKKHKKKSKGMGWYMSMHNGDVDKAIDVFNAAQPDGGVGMVSPANGQAMGEGISTIEAMQTLSHKKKFPKIKAAQVDSNLDALSQLRDIDE